MEGKFAVTQAGTPYYTSPEIWNNQKYDGKCDIWSLGCVLYELATLQTPFLAKDVPELVRKVNCGKLDPLPPTYSRTLSEIIHQCLTVNPGQRPSAAALLTHKVFQFMKSTEEAEGEINLLATIRCPKAYNLIQGQLPESKSCKKSALKNSLENANFRKAVSPNRPLQCPPKVPFQAERPYSPSWWAIVTMGS